MGRIPDGALVYSLKKVGKQEIPGRILWVGSTRDLPRRYRNSRRTQDLRGRRAVIPGLVDCHTHLVFAGDRSAEFARRCGGESYQKIASEGGGILTTVKATREATEAGLLRLAKARVRESLSYGVRTLELKSGYGLDEASELKQLVVARKLAKAFPEVGFQSTYLGAHAIPKGRSRQEYVSEIVEKTLPHIASQGLADSVDVFVDEGYFEVSDARMILAEAKRLGLSVKLHADELGNTESAALACELGALSADHLLQISERGIQALAGSETTAVLLPGTAYYLRAAHAPARRLIDAGARVAIATDFNPGTCMTLNLPLVLNIAALYLGMSRAELLASVTYNAACALGLQERRGSLEPGKDAAFAILPFMKFEELYYCFGWSA